MLLHIGRYSVSLCCVILRTSVGPVGSWRCFQVFARWEFWLPMRASKIAAISAAYYTRVGVCGICQSLLSSEVLTLQVGNHSPGFVASERGNANFNWGISMLRISASLETIRAPVCGLSSFKLGGIHFSKQSGAGFPPHCHLGQVSVMGYSVGLALAVPSLSLSSCELCRDLAIFITHRHISVLP